MSNHALFHIALVHITGELSGVLHKESLMFQNAIVDELYKGAYLSGGRNCFLTNPAL